MDRTWEMIFTSPELLPEQEQDIFSFPKRYCRFFESFTDFSLISDASEFVRDFAEEKFKSESSNFFFQHQLSSD